MFFSRGYVYTKNQSFDYHPLLVSEGNRNKFWWFHKPMFLRPHNPMNLKGMMYDQAGRRKPFIVASKQEVHQLVNSTVTKSQRRYPMFSGSSYPMRLVVMLIDRIGI
jgi:hypothetical protein